MQADSALTAMLANGSSSIYDDLAIQSDSYPYIIVDESELNPFNTHESTASMDEILVNVFCYSDRKNTVGGIYGTEDIANQIRVSMDSANGTYSNEVIKDIILESQSTYHERFGDKVIKVKEMSFQVLRNN